MTVEGTDLQHLKKKSKSERLQKKQEKENDILIIFILHYIKSAEIKDALDSDLDCHYF